ncbi:MAG TPA: LytTR family DNA-binding domain-containing protein [Longimicrobiales bacterium]|nr:LytTR family DNA-binding domain-containing protein [Longimicrobiales bacterium]
MRVRALIADDEPIARVGLRRMLADFEWIECVGEAATGPAAAAALDALRPDVVFLDIEMPGMNGIEVLRRAAHQPFAVFTTAYSQHAVSAFELGALDYLVKPFGPARLATAMERVRSGLGEPAPAPQRDRLAEALGATPMSRLFVRSGATLIPVAVADIGWFTAAGDYVEAHTGAGHHLVHVSLARIEARLDPRKFCRIHRTHVVNLDHVRTFRRAPNGRMVAELRDGTRLPVSRIHASELRGRGF